MYSITTTCLDGHNGLGTPDTCLVKTKGEARKELMEWFENASFFDDDDKDHTLLEIEGWDGKETIDLTNGDGEGIVVQRQRVKKCKSTST